jgi:transglutaminase-like putative cysteine protease
MVRLEYTIDLDYEIGGPADFVFVIAAARTPAQRVVAERLDLDHPAASAWCDDPRTHNRLLRLRTEATSLHVAYGATVELHHHFAEPATLAAAPLADVPVDVLPYLAASRYCQSDRLVEYAHAEFGAIAPGYARVEAIALWVRRHVRFKVGTSDTATTALDTLVGRQGVCRDFAHLAIALCRAQNVPARFVTGIDYGADPALGPCDFHAYVEAWIGDRWYLFDATGISPLTGLVRIGTGRDASDVAFATIYGPVRTHAPKVSVRAVDDPAHGIHLPQPTRLAVSTATADAPVAALAAGDTMTLPFLLQGARTPAEDRRAH